MQTIDGRKEKAIFICNIDAFRCIEWRTWAVTVTSKGESEHRILNTLVLNGPHVIHMRSPSPSNVDR